MTIAQIDEVNVSGGVLPAPRGEETLDVSWVSGIPPGAQVRVYASGSLSFVALELALDRIITDLPRHPGMRQLSISLGPGETFMSAMRARIPTQPAHSRTGRCKQSTKLPIRLSLALAAPACA